MVQPTIQRLFIAPSNREVTCHLSSFSPLVFLWELLCLVRSELTVCLQIWDSAHTCQHLRCLLLPTPPPVSTCCNPGTPSSMKPWGTSPVLCGWSHTASPQAICSRGSGVLWPHCSVTFHRTHNPHCRKKDRHFLPTFSSPLEASLVGP